MYELVNKELVIEEINRGAEMWCVDIPTQRVMACSDMSLQAIRSFITKPEAMFFKGTTSE